MTPEEELNSNIFSILKQIKKEAGLCDETSYFELNIDSIFENINPSLSPRLQRKILSKLESDGAISLQYTNDKKLRIGIDGDVVCCRRKKRFFDDTHVCIKILQPRFNEEYKKYNKILNTKSDLETTKKYHSIGENIELKTLGIVIEGDYIIYQKRKTQKINTTDKKLLNFLYLRFTEDRQICSKKGRLAQELGTSEGNVRNRISFINNEIRKIIACGKNNIDDLIKYEGIRRGYLLNPRFMIQFTKK